MGSEREVANANDDRIIIGSVLRGGEASLWDVPTALDALERLTIAYTDALGERDRLRMANRKARMNIADVHDRLADALGERDEARAAAERDRGKAVWMPICYSCGNGPLAGDSIQTGLCDECGEANTDGK
jgi:hypothetical protein